MKLEQQPPIRRTEEGHLQDHVQRSLQPPSHPVEAEAEGPADPNPETHHRLREQASQSAVLGEDVSE